MLICVGGARRNSEFTEPVAASLPTLKAWSDIGDVTRWGVAAVSASVDWVFNGRLLPEGGDVRALFKRGSATIGRMVARLSPLPPGAGTWSERLMGAPLSGGIRRSEEHTSELQSLMRISYAVFCLKKKQKS